MSAHLASKAAFAALLLGGCGKMKADVSGDISGIPLPEVVTVWSGGPFIVLFDREIDCIDTAWVDKAYIDGVPPTDVPFVAVQFGNDDPWAVGTQSVEGQAAVTGWGMSNDGTDFELHRAREGTINIDGIDKNGQWIQGNFDITFAEGEVSGTFTSEFCRNLQP
jgi:hypothetical protein